MVQHLRVQVIDETKVRSHILPNWKDCACNQFTILSLVKEYNLMIKLDSDQTSKWNEQ